MIKVWKSELEYEPYISPIGAGDLVDIFNYDGAFIEGYFLTAQELEDRERKAFEAGALRTGFVGGGKEPEWVDTGRKYKSYDDYKREQEK